MPLNVALGVLMPPQLELCTTRGDDITVRVIELKGHKKSQID